MAARPLPQLQRHQLRVHHRRLAKEAASSPHQRNASGAVKRRRTDETARALETAPEIDEIGHATEIVIDGDRETGAAEIVETDGVRARGTSDREIGGPEIDAPGIAEIAGIEMTGIAAKEIARAAAVLSKCWQTLLPLEVSLDLPRLEMPRRQHLPQSRQMTAAKNPGSRGGVASPTTCPTG